MPSSVTNRPLTAGDPRRGAFAHRLTLHAGSTTLLQEATFSVQGGRQVALVGRNGSGKSTLLATIESISRTGDPPSGITLQGELRLAPGLSVGHLPQSPQLAHPGAVAGYLDARGGPAAHASASYRRLAEEVAAGATDERTLTAYGELLEEMNRVDGWGHEARREQVLVGLGLDAALLDRPLATLSG
ncbi:MAG: ABC-F family ATP-binding cassette domain-containing protein, partial [Acidimicrobiaceae bacterium]|nr:ABC-F family ATP-binding cassette domain-containing protein [Acidimicrobiaceae bacterium]